MWQLHSALKSKENEGKLRGTGRKDYFYYKPSFGIQTIEVDVVVMMSPNNRMFLNGALLCTF